MRSVFLASFLSLLLVGCGAPADEPVALPALLAASAASPSASASPLLAGPKLSAELVIDPGPGAGTEAYLCFAVPILDAGSVQVERIKWFPPMGPVILHHASLYAARGPLPSGAIPCDPLPDLVATLGLYTPGAEPVSFPPGVAVQFPEGTTHLFIGAHVLRLDDGAAEPTRVELGLARAPAPHAAQWVDVFADVPPLLPHQTSRSVGSCRFLVPTSIVTVWAHMHRFGKRFDGTIVRADGRREPLIEIPVWDFDHQPIYPVSAHLEPGDSVETRCEWTNTSADVVEPGPFTRDEMCNQGLFVWPPEAARCLPFSP